MAFKFTWPIFSESFYETARNLLTSALSKAPIPPIITDNILVKEFNLGTKAPDLEMLEIGELGDDKFRGVFKLNYSGDAFIVLQTKVQVPFTPFVAQFSCKANPLNTRSQLTPGFTSQGILAADVPLTVPMFLRLSYFQLSGIIILVFSKQKGLTLVFRNDPVDSVKVSSTFDSIPAIQRFLQAEIERLLRDLMREEVPAIIHKLSLEWAMRNQADECLSPASLTNTDHILPAQSERVQQSPNSSSYSLEMEPNDPLRPILAATNLLRLAELNNAQTTLSPFTASIPNSVFRSSAALMLQMHSSRHSRRRDWPSIKTSESESNVQHSASFISPPESVHSAQSMDASSVSVRPSLYHSRQRSSYLRRPLQPKRKVVRLHPKESASESTSNIDSASENGDYFSEPGGYRYPEYQWNPSGTTNMHSKLPETPIREENWNMSQSMDGNSSASSHFSPTSHISGSTVVGDSSKGEEISIGGLGGERFVPSHLIRKIIA